VVVLLGITKEMKYCYDGNICDGMKNSDTGSNLVTKHSCSLAGGKSWGNIKFQDRNGTILLDRHCELCTESKKSAEFEPDKPRGRLIYDLHLIC